MVLVVAMPGAVVLLGSLVYRMVPAFQQMQTRIDRVNTVLREQITGIRVVRAFVREPEETDRFSRGQRRADRHVAARRPPDVGDVPDGRV